MTEYAIERNGKLVQVVEFIGDASKNLYRDKRVVVALFTTEKAAESVANALGGIVVNYGYYMSEATKKAA